MASLRISSLFHHHRSVSLPRSRVGDSSSRVKFSRPTPTTARNLSGFSSMTEPSSVGAGKGESNDNDNDNDVLLQYVVLRRDLIDAWPLGSLVTQGCHASVAAIWSCKDDPHTLQYCGPHTIDSMHKVTLEVKGETQLVKLSEKLTNGGIWHKLWIEQPENIPTCLATKPYPKSQVSTFFKKLKLWLNKKKQRKNIFRLQQQQQSGQLRVRA